MVNVIQWRSTHFAWYCKESGVLSAFAWALCITKFLSILHVHVARECAQSVSGLSEQNVLAEPEAISPLDLFMSCICASVLNILYAACISLCSECAACPDLSYSSLFLLVFSSSVSARQPGYGRSVDRGPVRKLVARVPVVRSLCSRGTSRSEIWVRDR